MFCAGMLRFLDERVHRGRGHTSGSRRYLLGREVDGWCHRGIGNEHVYDILYQMGFARPVFQNLVVGPDKNVHWPELQ